MDTIAAYVIGWGKQRSPPYQVIDMSFCVNCFEVGQEPDLPQRDL